jgi:hypothetical protein
MHDNDTPIQRDNSLKMVPDDGFAYQPVELEAIWNMHVDYVDVFNGPLFKRWVFFHEAQKDGRHPADSIVHLILNDALIAEYEDREPEYPDMGQIYGDGRFYIGYNEETDSA